MNGVSFAKAALRFVGISVLVSACHSAQSDWTKASRDNTVVSYENFLAAHPRDSHSFEARAMVLQINDDGGWQGAQYAGTRSAYQTYLLRFPQGAHLVAARNEVTTFDRSAAWTSAQETGTAAAVQAFLRTYYSGPEVAQAKAKLRDLTSYHAHLSTESTFERARRKKDQLKSRLNDPAVQFAITPNDNETSFSVDGVNMTEQGARSACEEFRRGREACQVIKN